MQEEQVVGKEVGGRRYSYTLLYLNKTLFTELGILVHKYA